MTRANVSKGGMKNHQTGFEMSKIHVVLIPFVNLLAFPQ